MRYKSEEKLLGEAVDAEKCRRGVFCGFGGNTPMQTWFNSNDWIQINDKRRKQGQLNKSNGS